jgi:hypothetical protein
MIVVHHTAVSRKDAPIQFFAVNRYHRSDPNVYLGQDSTLGYAGGYHVFIEPDGTELRYREDWEEGAHTKGHNLDSLGVCLAMDGDREFPTDAQVKTLKERLRKWCAGYQIPAAKIYPHRAFSAKSCYGYMLADDWARKLAEPPPPPPDPDARKRAEIASLQQRLIDLVRQLILLLKIRYGLASARKKEPGVG